MFSEKDIKELHIKICDEIKDNVIFIRKNNLNYHSMQGWIKREPKKWTDRRFLKQLNKLHYLIYGEYNVDINSLI